MSEKIETYRIMPEPRYVKLYFDSADMFDGITNNQISLLMFLLSKSYDESGVCKVIIDLETKEDIIFQLGWKKNTFDNALRGLKKLGLVVKANKNVYIFNPEVLEPKGG